MIKCCIIIFRLAGSDAHVCSSSAGGTTAWLSNVCCCSAKKGSIFEEKEEDDIISQLFYDYSIYTGCLKVSVSNVMTVIYRVFLKNRLRIRPPGVYFVILFAAARWPTGHFGQPR